MQAAKRDVFEKCSSSLTVTHSIAGSPRRKATESFIRTIFARRHGAAVSSFAPNLLLLEEHDRTVAAAGWRTAKDEALFLERYLDQPIEQAMAQVTDQSVHRGNIVEVGNLAAEKPGGTVQVVLALAAHLDRPGYEWVVFTATRELIGMFTRLGLPLLALAPANPARLGNAAGVWGSYYDTQPIVVATRIRMFRERLDRRA